MRHETKGLSMPRLAAYRRGELSAQNAINLAEYWDEALEIIRAVNRQQADRIEDEGRGLL